MKGTAKKVSPYINIIIPIARLYIIHLNSPNCFKQKLPPFLCFDLHHPSSPGRRCGFDTKRQRCSRSWELWSDGIGGEAELGDEDSTPRRSTPSMMRPWPHLTPVRVLITLPPIIVEKVENWVLVECKETNIGDIPFFTEPWLWEEG